MLISLVQSHLISIFSGVRPKGIDKHYRCIVPRFPAATIAIFVRDKRGKIEFKGVEKDDYVNENFKDFQNYPYIYNNLAYGDSGGPISTKVYDSNLNFDSVYNSNTGEFTGEKRHVIVAVTSLGTGIKPLLTNEGPLSTKCISFGSKVTKDVVDWIKEVHTRYDQPSNKNILL